MFSAQTEVIIELLNSNISFKSSYNIHVYGRSQGAFSIASFNFSLSADLKSHTARLNALDRCSLISRVP